MSVGLGAGLAHPGPYFFGFLKMNITQFESFEYSGHDYLIVADGSGNLADKPCGWCFVMLQVATGRVTKHLGGTSGGTNNFAELMPFLQALWLIQNEMDSKLGQKAKFKVLCVTDSEVTAKIGGGEYTASKNLALWAAIHWFEDNGYCLKWQWVPRNSNSANVFVDVCGKTARQAMKTASDLSF